jgi:hypothetical protein
MPKPEIAAVIAYEERVSHNLAAGLERDYSTAIYC